MAVSIPLERQRELTGIALMGVTTVLFLALITDEFPASDYTVRHLDGIFEFQNLLSVPGAVIAGFLAIALGDASHVLYSVTFVWATMLLGHRRLDRPIARVGGMLLFTACVAGLLHIDLTAGAANPEYPGGLVGGFMAERVFQSHFGPIGAHVIALMLAAIGLLLATDLVLVQAIGLLTRSAFFVRGRQAAKGSRVSAYESVRAARAADGENRMERERARVAPERRPSWRDAFGKPRRQASARDERPSEGAWARTAAPALHAYDPIAETPPPVEEPLPFDSVPEPADADADADRNGYGYDDGPVAAGAIDRSNGAGSNGWGDLAEAGHGNGNGHSPRAGFDMEPKPAIDLDETPLFADEPASPAHAEGVDDADTNVVLLGFESTKGTGQLEFLPPAEEAEPPPRRLVRKRRAEAEVEELPEDYVYPRRYTMPGCDMLDEPEPRIIPNLEEKLRATGLLLEETLETFGISATVTEIVRGPTITRFELEPAPGIKVSRFAALADDLALALKAHRVRVEAPIPGKGRVGVEVPNRERDQVLIRELLESGCFARKKGKLKLALGKDIAGDVHVADLASMPHLLVAGATGSGKTVCVKALLASLLFQHTPDQLQLVLIDPKMVEFTVFNDIPHLMTPVVVDPKKAANALTWLIHEMEERYRLFADLRVRNIEVYNQSVENGEIQLEGAEPGSQGELHLVRKLPYIVCIIDELADLMMLARAEVEDAIARLAQLARAVGIHLIIATQRPSVDVLTGVIKANFPARISFQVSSRVDSRCILDEIGAERLIGMGDMLYLPAGQSKPTRMQGAFVSDSEMALLVGHLKRQAPPQYRDEIQNFGKSKDKSVELAEEDDPVFDDAVQVVLETGQASISMVQRRLRVGYTRAARLIDMMELRGIVGPHTGSKAREILVSSPARDGDT